MPTRWDWRYWIYKRDCFIIYSTSDFNVNFNYLYLEDMYEEGHHDKRYFVLYNEDVGGHEGC